MDDFQRTFFDMRQVFPPVPIPGSSLVVDPTNQSDNGARAKLKDLLRNKQWPSLRADKLPWMLQEKPSQAYDMLTPAGAAYFLPAFLRMCEMEPERARGVPDALVSKLCGDSEDSKELRSLLSEMQKRCIVAFFDGWHKGADTLREKLLPTTR